MRHSTTFLMLLIVASILVLMFLNLVLGSVSIPLKSVWNIICGLGDEPVTWQNIVWKSRLPQALTEFSSNQTAGSGVDGWSSNFEAEAGKRHRSYSFTSPEQEGGGRGLPSL